MTKKNPIGHETRSEDRVPLREKIGIGLGRVAADGTAGTIHTLINQVYNMTLGVNPALLSTAVFIQRLWDAMLDPALGQFSDNFRSRWGRRIPLLAIAALPLSVLFGAIWWFPAGLGQYGLFAYLIVISLSFYAFHSLYSMPLNGLLIEATDDYHERTRVAVIVAVFTLSFQIFGQWIFPLTQLDYFGDPVRGVRWVAGSCAVLFLVCAILPVFLCRERHYARVAAVQPRITFREGVQHVRENRPLLHLIAARFIASFTYNVVGMFGIYMNCYYVFGGHLKSAAFAYGVLGSAYMISGVVSSIWLYPPLARRCGKKRTFQLAALILIAGCLAKLVVYQPAHPWLQLIVLITNGASGAGMALMVTSMLGDIADYNEWRTGQRNEAFLASILGWFDKVGNSFGSLLGGFILVAIGFDATRGGQTAATLVWMKYSYCFLPFTGAVVAIGLLHRYELDEDRVYAIQSALDLRHEQTRSAEATLSH